MGSSGGSGDISARVFKSGAQSIPSAADTVLVFPSESYDTASLHDPAVNNERLTAPIRGKYLIVGLPMWAGVAAPTSRRQCSIRLNGVTVLAYCIHEEADSVDENIAIPVVSIELLEANDYVELVVNHLQGAAVSIQGGTRDQSFFSMARLP